MARSKHLIDPEEEVGKNFALVLIKSFSLNAHKLTAEVYFSFAEFSTQFVFFSRLGISPS
jgi:hypothetical protein